LADGDGLAHLLSGEPASLANKLALHLPDKRNRPAEADEPEAQEILNEFSNPAA